MTKDDLDNKIAVIKNDSSKTFEITPRQLINALGCERRTKNNTAEIDDFLNEHRIETVPSYLDIWVDASIILRHKEKATTRTEFDPIKRLQILKAANIKPTSINPDADLQKAITLMLHNDYSQLPVATNDRDARGFISWETIAKAYLSKKTITKVSDCMEKDINILPLDKPLLDSMKVINEHGFVLVKGSDNVICGIVTVADISYVLGYITEPFMLLEEIEKNLRLLLDGIFLKEDLARMFPDFSYSTIDDLTFGDYIRIIENESNWKKLSIMADRSKVKNVLDEIRNIRNDVMHFDPDGLSHSDFESLRKASRFVAKLRSLK